MSTEPERMDASELPPLRKNRQKGRKYGDSRGPNSRNRRDDAFRLKTGAKVLNDYRNQRADKFGVNTNIEIPGISFSIPASFTERKPTAVVKRIPFATVGLGLSVSQIFFRFQNAFRAGNCSIFQFYRVTLFQFEMQRFMTYQRSTEVYPSDFLVTQLGVEYQNVLRANPDNFLQIVQIIECFGRFDSNGMSFVTVVPKECIGDPWYVTATSLRSLVSDLASEGDHSAWAGRNSLPGSVWRENAAGHLQLDNAAAFWPDGYDHEWLVSDMMALKRVLEGTKPKFEIVMSRCTYGGTGKPAALVSVKDPPLKLYCEKVYQPRSPTMAPSEQIVEATSSGPRKRPRVEEDLATCDKSLADTHINLPPILTTPVEWYTPHTLESVDFLLGILAVAGTTTNQLESDLPLFRSRCEVNSATWMTESWITVFDSSLPCVRKS